MFQQNSSASSSSSSSLSSSSSTSSLSPTSSRSISLRESKASNDLTDSKKLDMNFDSQLPPYHSDFILNGLQILKTNKILCDITLIAENVKFQVHKVIMASCSDYFRSMFTSGMKESTQTEIELKGVSAKGLEKVIEIIYTSHTHFETHTDMFEVISAAIHLQCLLVVEYCEKNFLSRLNCYNFNYYIQMAKLYRLDNALKQIDLFIINNLAQIIQIQQQYSLGKDQNQFNYQLCDLNNQDHCYLDDGDECVGLRCLSYEQLLKCLRHNELRIKEIDLFLLTWQWINETLFLKASLNFKNKKSCLVFSNDIKKAKKLPSKLDKYETKLTKRFNLNERIRTETKSKRKIEIIRCLMRQIRFALISPSDLVQKVQSINKIMTTDHYLRNLLLNALNYHVIPFSQVTYYNKDENETEKTIEQCESKNEKFKFSINLRSPIKLPLMIGGREINPNPSLQEACYILNEYSQTSVNSSISNKKLNFIPNTLNKTIPNIYNPNSTGSTTINRLSLTSLPNVLSHMQCVVVESNFLYVIGGCISQCAHGESAVNTTYRYDPRFNTWMNVCSMLDKRAYFYSCCLEIETTNRNIKNNDNSEKIARKKQFIYSIGGKNKDGSLFSVERYDLENNVWQYVRSISSTYYAHAGCVLENRAYISGGYSHGQFTGDLHVYSPQTDQWDELRPMNSPRGWHCMCVSNGRLYVFGGCYLNSSSNNTNQIPTTPPTTTTTTPTSLIPITTNSQQSMPSNNSASINHQQQQQQTAQPVTVAEYYSPQTDQWTLIKPMINLHKEANSFKINDYIFILGGYNIQAKTGQKLISRYDCLNDLWHTVDQLPCGITGFGCCLIDLPWYVLDNELDATDNVGLTKNFQFPTNTNSMTKTTMMNKLNHNYYDYEDDEEDDNQEKFQSSRNKRIRKKLDYDCEKFDIDDETKSDQEDFDDEEEENSYDDNDDQNKSFLDEDNDDDDDQDNLTNLRQKNEINILDKNLKSRQK